MLQSWHALKLQVGQKQPSRGAERAALSAASRGEGCHCSASSQAQRPDLRPALRPWARSPERDSFPFLRISQQRWCGECERGGSVSPRSSCRCYSEQRRGGGSLGPK